MYLAYQSKRQNQRETETKKKKKQLLKKIEKTKTNTYTEKLAIRLDTDLLTLCLPSLPSSPAAGSDGRGHLKPIQSLALSLVT